MKMYEEICGTLNFTDSSKITKLLITKITKTIHESVKNIYS